MRHNLPSPRTRFIGRETALAACRRLLEDACLLTVTGLGGAGKTRLALQLASGLADDRSGDAAAETPERRTGTLERFDQICFVDLAPVREPDRVVLSIAGALAVREESGSTVIDRIGAAIAGRRVLLVVDNCEHLVDAVAPAIDALLAVAPDLKVVATSRERLGVAGEQVFAIVPLSLPAVDCGGAADPAVIAKSEAVRVFVDRARLVAPDFVLDANSAAAVAEICRRLDGIALAIELAAARVAMLSVADIAARLDDRFRFLTGGHRSLPRHETLAATLQWSHDSLTDEQQRLFRELAVFAGGCTLEGAAAVADVDDDHVVLERLTRLHDKSLLVVVRNAAGAPRYRMLETVREYASRRLVAAGDEAVVRDRHLRWAVALAGEAPRGLQGPRQGDWMARLCAEEENLLAAHRWCARSVDGNAAALRLVAGLPRFWLNAAKGEQGYRLAVAALAAAEPDSDPALRCDALVAIGTLAFRLGRYDEALGYADDCVSLARTIDDREQLVAAMSLRAKSLHSTGELALALEQSLATCDAARALGVTVRLSAALNNLAEVYRNLDRLDEAAACYDEAIAVTRSLQYAGGTFVSSSNLARLLITTGDRTRAHALLLECIALWKSAGLRGMGKDVFEVAAGLAATAGRWSAAARYAGAAAARIDEAGSRRQAVDEAFLAPLLAEARAADGATAFAAATAAGYGLAYDEAIDDVERWLGEPDRWGRDGIVVDGSPARVAHVGAAA